MASTILSEVPSLLPCEASTKGTSHDEPSPIPPHSTTKAPQHYVTTIPSPTTPTALSATHLDVKMRTLILDLGDVLFHYAVSEITALSPPNFKSVITTPGWADFECGRVNEDEALESITKELCLDPDLVRKALSQCRRLLHVDHDLYDELCTLKAEMKGNLKVYAMTNISRDDFAGLKNILPSWDLFDAEFTSFDAGMIKPHLGYYQHVLDSIGLVDPTTAIFVDDKAVNVYAARSFGIRGIVFDDPAKLMDQLRAELLPKSVSRFR